MRRLTLLTLVFVVGGLCAASAWVVVGRGPTASTVLAILQRMRAPFDHDTVRLQGRLRAYGPAVVPAIRAFCSDVERPVLLDLARRRAAAAAVLRSFYEDPAAVASLVSLASSQDGILRQRCLRDLRYQWGEGVLEALRAAIDEGGVRLYALRRRKGPPHRRWVVLEDFDKTAVESLAVMYEVYRKGRPDRAAAVKDLLEYARTKDRLAASASKALAP